MWKLFLGDWRLVSPPALLVVTGCADAPIFRLRRRPYTSSHSARTSPACVSASGVPSQTTWPWPMI